MPSSPSSNMYCVRCCRGRCQTDSAIGNKIGMVQNPHPGAGAATCRLKQIRAVWILTIGSTRSPRQCLMTALPTSVLEHGTPIGTNQAEHHPERPEGKRCIARITGYRSRTVKWRRTKCWQPRPNHAGREQKAAMADRSAAPASGDFRPRPRSKCATGRMRTQPKS